jgi:uncharacterized protein
MKEEYLNLPLVKNEAEHRFEMKVGEYTAFIEYKQNSNKIKLIHTEVSPELEGRGAATAIIEKTLEYIEENKFKLIPICPFVVAYIKRHPQWIRIVDKK